MAMGPRPGETEGEGRVRNVELCLCVRELGQPLRGRGRLTWIFAR